MPRNKISVSYYVICVTYKKITNKASLKKHFQNDYVNKLFSQPE